MLDDIQHIIPLLQPTARLLFCCSSGRGKQEGKRTYINMFDMAWLHVHTFTETAFGGSHRTTEETIGVNASLTRAGNSKSQRLLATLPH